MTMIAEAMMTVITVIITQPGMSPRWSRHRRTAYRLLSNAAILICPPCLVSRLRRRSRRQHVQSHDAREEREEQGHRHDQEDHRDHYRDLLARTGLDQRPL